MPEVNQKAIAEWVAALRSDNFEQAQGTLVKDGSYCCLGVACEIFAGRVGLTPIRQVFPSRDVIFGYSYTSSDEIICEAHDDLPPPLYRFMGFADGFPVVRVDEEGDVSLTVLNDEWGWDFHRIADAIEATYLKGVPRFSGESEDTGEPVD